MDDEEERQIEKGFAYLGELLEAVCEHLENVLKRLDTIIGRIPTAPPPAAPPTVPPPASAPRKGTRLSEVAEKIKSEQSKGSGKGRK